MTNPTELIEQTRHAVQYLDPNCPVLLTELADALEVLQAQCDRANKLRVEAQAISSSRLGEAEQDRRTIAALQAERDEWKRISELGEKAVNDAAATIEALQGERDELQQYRSQLESGITALQAENERLNDG